MLESEKAEILRELQKGRDAVAAALAGVDEGEAARKPAPERWSILECVEHLVAAEQFLQSRLATATLSDRPAGNRERDTAILARGADRSRPVQSPEPGRPTGRFRSLREAVAAFDSVRAETVRYVETHEGDPRRGVTDHPLVPVPVTCYKMLLIMAAHSVRHAKQIAEARAALASVLRQ
jgi:uncharacterized damage-inducible protein DinB